MTAINHYLPAETLGRIYKREGEDKVSGVIDRLRHQFYSEAIEGTEDMDDIGLASHQGVAKARSMMDVNVLPISGGSKTKILYVPVSVFKQISEGSMQVEEVLFSSIDGWVGSIPSYGGRTRIMPILGDKDVVMMRASDIESKGELTDVTEKVREEILANFDIPEGTIYEGLIVPKDRVITQQSMVELEGYDKEFRVDSDGYFQKHIRQNAPSVDQRLREGRYDAGLEVQARFSGADTSYMIFPD